MIAPNRCATDEELVAILDDELPCDQMELLTDHVGRCERCYHQMEALAGNVEWWVKSREHLTGVESSPFQKESTATFPDHLAHYRIDGVIGFGGMATVYRGFDPQLNRPVAIKVLHPHLAATGNSRQRFLREGQSAASIAHPNVIPIYGVHHVEGKTFLVMPLITGGSLHQRIEREGPLGLEDVLRIALQIAEGLAAAHSHGVIHRDVKPANILLEDGSRRVLLSDFGLARTLDDATLTASGLISGTPAFMSPEQARGESIDFRSDLFSLGSVIFAMCTGHSPFQASSTLRLLREVGESQYPSVHRYQEQLPVWVDALIQRLTAPDLDQRVDDDEAAELLRECLMHVMQPQDNTLPRSLLTKSQRHSAKARATWIVASGLGAVALSFAIWSNAWFSRPQNHVGPDQTQAIQIVKPLVPPGSTLLQRPPSLTDWDDGLDNEVNEIQKLLETNWEGAL